MNNDTAPNQPINADPAELERFNRLADQWWDSEGPMKPLHGLNPVRLQFITEHTPLNGLKVLDVGCGGGLLAEAMCQQGATVSALDLSKDLLAAAQQHAKQQALDIDYQAIPVEEFSALHTQQFDVVTCMEMLEHVPDPQSIISACVRCCKPGGTIFFSTLNRNLKSFALGIVAAEYILSLLPKGTHEYAKFIKPSELCHFARHAGLTLKSMQGIHYDPFKNSATLNRDTSVNYLAAFTMTAA